VKGAAYELPRCPYPSGRYGYGLQRAGRVIEAGKVLIGEE